jgi:thioredoxin 1
LQEVAGEWKVDAMPTFVLAKRGEEVTRVVGANKDELEKNIAAHRLS